MELQQVRYFLALADSLNFTRAAAQCDVTQPALTRAIQKLEHELGGTLIHREGHLTQLTDLGKLLLPTFEQFTSAASLVRKTAMEFRRREIANFVIGIAPPTSAALVVEPLRDVARFVPGLQVEFVEDSQEQLVQMMLEGQVSAAVVGNPRSLSDRIDSLPLFEEGYVVAVSTNHVLASAKLISPDELNNLPLLVHAGWPPHRKLASDARGQPPDRTCHRADSASNLQYMAAAGLGAMILPEHVPLLQSLVAIPVPSMSLRHSVHVLVVAGRPFSPTLRSFLQVVRACDWSRKLVALSQAA